MGSIIVCYRLVKKPNGNVVLPPTQILEVYKSNIHTRQAMC